METIALLLVAVAALSVAAANLVLALCFVSKREKNKEPSATKEELEAEQKRLEQQRFELEGIANQMAFSGFAWRDGKKK